MTVSGVVTAAEPGLMIDRSLFDRLVETIASDGRFDRAMAERIMGQALVFLKACADNPGTLLSPTKIVDVGWHAFLLHTSEYADFCDRFAGRFIHHNPELTKEIRSGAALLRTIDALQMTGLRVDEELWRSDPADCNQCHAGCHDSP